MITITNLLLTSFTVLILNGLNTCAIYTNNMVSKRSKYSSFIPLSSSTFFDYIKSSPTPTSSELSQVRNLGLELLENMKPPQMKDEAWR